MAWPSDLVRTKDWGNEVLTDSDLEGQFDLIINWLDAFADETSGHKHDGTSNEGPKINLTNAVSGTLPLANGGTGQTTLAGLLGLVYPVGCIYTNITGVNPATELGFGTWSAFGAGRVLVGKDASDTDFDTDEETGGAKTFDNSHNHGGKTGIQQNITAGTGFAVGAADKNHDHSISSAGSSTQSIVQPYVVVNFWKRTA